MRYDSYRYLFPPRPEHKAPPTSITTYTKMGMVAQPKLNGMCATLFTNGTELIFMNRHNEPINNMMLSKEELLSLHRGDGWMVICGELLNKSQRDLNKKVFNGKFVIFDILVYNGEYLTGKTFDQRQEILDSMYELSEHDDWINKTRYENVYRVKNLITNVAEMWDKLTSVEMYEGYVFKTRGAQLQASFNQANNHGWQVKVRKPTKNYKF